MRTKGIGPAGALLIAALAVGLAPTATAEDPDRGYVECVVEFVVSQVSQPTGCAESDDLTGQELDECSDEIKVEPNEELVRQCLVAA